MQANRPAQHELAHNLAHKELAPGDFEEQTSSIRATVCPARRALRLARVEPGAGQRAKHPRNRKSGFKGVEFA